MTGISFPRPSRLIVAVFPRWTRSPGKHGRSGLGGTNKIVSRYIDLPKTIRKVPSMTALSPFAVRTPSSEQKRCGSPLHSTTAETGTKAKHAGIILACTRAARTVCDRPADHARKQASGSSSGCPTARTGSRLIRGLPLGTIHIPLCHSIGLRLVHLRLSVYWMFPFPPWRLDPTRRVKKRRTSQFLSRSDSTASNT